MGHKRHQLVALIYDKRDRLLAVGRNSYIKTHPLQHKYSRGTDKPDRTYLHAELDGLLKASRRGKPYRIVVQRMNKKGQPLLAKPCEACMRAIEDFKIQRVEWTA